MVYTSRIRENADRRPLAFWGALIPAAINFVGGLITSSQQAKAQKRALEEQQRLAQQQLNISNQNQLASTLNNYALAQQSYDDKDYNLKYRIGGVKRLGSKNIMITDGGTAKRIGNNTYLLRGGSHEDINETGQTGIGINVGGNEIEAEGGEVAQRKGNSLRIYSAQPILGGMSPAQAIMRGYNKDKVFNAQQRFKKNNGIKDDGSQQRNGGLTSKDRGSSKHPYPSVLSKDFAGGNRSYPIPTKADAIDALRLAGLHGRSDVRSKVYSKYPSLRPKAAFGDWVRTNRDDNILANLLYESGIIDKNAWRSMLRDIHTFTGMGSDPYNDDQDEAVVTPGFGIPNQAQILRNVQQANRVAQSARASQAVQRSSYAAKQAKDFYRGLGINIPIGRSQTYNPAFRSSELARNIESSNEALKTFLNNTHLPKGIRLTPVDQSIIDRTAARVINPREAELVKQGINISQSAKNMTNGANPFLYTSRSSNEILEGLNRVIASAKQGAKNVGQRVGNNRAVREFRNLSNKDKAKYIGMAGFYSNDKTTGGTWNGNVFVPNIWQFGNNGNSRRNKYMNNSGEGYFNGRVNIFPKYRKRIAKRMGCLTNQPVGRFKCGGRIRPKAEDGMLAPVYSYGINRRKLPSFAPIDITPRAIPNFKPISVPINAKTPFDPNSVPYLGKQSSFKPTTQDYIGLGIDTLASLGSGMFTRSAYNKMNFDYALPNYVDESPVAFDTTYHNEAQRANIERNRLNARNLIRGNTASAQTSLGRMQQSDVDAMMETNKLLDEKSNKEVELRNQNAANEQQVRARNAAARNQYYQNVAQIKNAAIEAKNNAELAKTQSIGAELSGLSQAWTNFASSIENRYDNRQKETIIAATAKDPAVLSNAVQFGYNFSPEVLAAIYNSTDDDNLKSLALSQLSTKNRLRYGIR